MNKDDKKVTFNLQQNKTISYAIEEGKNLRKRPKDKPARNLDLSGQGFNETTMLDCVLVEVNKINSIIQDKNEDTDDKLQNIVIHQDRIQKIVLNLEKIKIKDRKNFQIPHDTQIAKQWLDEEEVEDLIEKNYEQYKENFKTTKEQTIPILVMDVAKTISKFFDKNEKQLNQLSEKMNNLAQDLNKIYRPIVEKIKVLTKEINSKPKGIMARFRKIFTDPYRKWSRGKLERKLVGPKQDQKMAQNMQTKIESSRKTNQFLKKSGKERVPFSHAKSTKQRPVKFGYVSAKKPSNLKKPKSNRADSVKAKIETSTAIQSSKTNPAPGESFSKSDTKETQTKKLGR